MKYAILLVNAERQVERFYWHKNIVHDNSQKREVDHD